MQIHLLRETSSKLAWRVALIPSDASHVRRPVPAWVTSLVVHAVILIGCVLFLRSQTTTSGGGEAERSGAIVLARVTPTGQTYFDESDAAASSAAAVDTVPTEALPSQVAPAELELNDVELPGLPADAGSLDANRLLPSPDLSGTDRQTLLPGQGDEEILADDAAMRAARGAAVPATQLSIFGSGPATGASFVFVIDRSKSMGSEGLDALAAAQRELALALANLEPQHEFQIIAYHHKLQYMNERALLKATESNRLQLNKFFGGLAAFGGTDHARAMVAAMHLHPDVVFLLTDGGDPHLTKPQMAEIRRMGRGGRTKIHCIQFGYGPLQNVDTFMRRLALDNGGGFQYVDVTK